MAKRSFEKMIKTGCNDLDNLIQGYKNEITLIYGPAGSGKTTLAKLAAISMAKKNGKVVFLDAENSFSVERLIQMSGGAYMDILNKILLLKVNNLEDQSKKIEMLKNLIDVNLIVVDSLGIHYRKEPNKEEANRKLAKQLKSLSCLARKGVPILLTNQVYSDLNNGTCVVGGNMVENWAKCLIELQKEPRKLVVKKPSNLEMFYEINNEGIKRKDL